MDDYTMSEGDVCGLKEALCAQQHLLQKLYNELEAEREASASAASEALSVILRLQGEKAMVMMEAEHYKRVSEEKICHAEESLSIVEDVIYQKDMEVAALDHQVQAYRFKLLSMGFTDVGFGDNVLERSEKEVGETSVESIGRRNSAPVCHEYKKASSERGSCSVVETDLASRIVEEKMRLEVCDHASGSDKGTGSSSLRGINSYCEQIRKLDVRVKEIAGGNYVNSRCKTWSPSPMSSHTSSGNLCDVSSSARNKTKSSESRNGVAIDSSCSTSIHDVFEVPRADEDLNSRESLERQGVVHPEAVKMDARDETGWLKKALESAQSESKLCQKSDFSCNLVVVEPRACASVYQLDRTSEIVEEVERPSESCNREEEVKLLNEIKEKLDSLHYEIRELKVKKSLARDEPSLSILSEAMLSFWL